MSVFRQVQQHLSNEERIAVRLGLQPFRQAIGPRLEFFARKLREVLADGRHIESGERDPLDVVRALQIGEGLAQEMIRIDLRVPERRQ